MAGGTEDKRQKDDAKGFAGLSSLVSDIDATVSDAARKSESSQLAADREPTRTPPSPPPAETHHNYEPPPQSSSGSSAGKWIVGVAVVFGLIWIVSLSDKRTANTSPTYTPVPEQQAAVTSPPVWQQPSPTAVQPSRPSETPPPVGNGLSLSTPQLRYCKAEKIRLDAANGVINSYSDTDIDRFNALVADYNSRCGQFKYRRGTLESARSEVEQHRSEIEAEGRARFSRTSTPAGTVVQAPDVAIAKPDFTVQAIQRRLNKFGYDAGEEDGFDGDQTRAAISAFQRDEKIAVDGKASSALLKRLSEHVEIPAQPTVKQKPPSIVERPTASNSRESSAPANSFISGDKWYCKDGFRKVGESCDQVQAPQNSFVSGDKWYCKDGYRKVGESCDQVKAPQNSFVSGDKWYCKDGYRKVGESCDPVIAPQNSFISGDKWYCKDGYRKVGENCSPI